MWDNFSIEQFSALKYPLISLALILGFFLLTLRSKDFLRSSYWGIFSLLVKLALIAALGLIVARAYYQEKIPMQQIDVALDLSESMSESETEELFASLKGFLTDDQSDFRLLPFAGRVGQGIKLGRDFPSYQSLKEDSLGLDLGKTNLEALIKELETTTILISDAHETMGSFEKTLSGALIESPKIFPLLPLKAKEIKDELSISKFFGPQLVKSQTAIILETAIKNSSAKEQTGELVFFQGEKEITRKEISLLANTERLEKLEVAGVSEGVNEFSVKLLPADSNYREQTKKTYVSGIMREKILLLSGTKDDTRYFEEALKKLKFQVDSFVAKGDLQVKDIDLPKYFAVILNNIHKKDLPDGFLSSIESHVKAGGGLIMLGGNQSFGLGGYIGSEVEELLPVKLVPPQSIQKKLNLAVMLLLDKSASMGKQSKLDYARLASKAVIESLKDQDYFGLIGFDDQPFHIVEMEQLAKNREKALKNINLLHAAGTTELFRALNWAKKDLDKAAAGKKHMIILTDGDIPNGFSQKDYYTKLVQEMRLTGTTVSTFLIGPYEERLLRSIARAGGGAFYRVSNVKNLPRLFLKDIVVTTGELTQRESAVYEVGRGKAKRASTDLKSFPRLRGYVQTINKEEANLELLVYGGASPEPLLSSWRYGDGKVMAYTSDANGRWSSEWITWARYTQFWTDLIESIKASEFDLAEIDFDLRHQLKGNELLLDLAIYAENYTQAILANVNYPDGSRKEIALQSSKPGKYQGKVSGLIPGRYQVDLVSGKRKLTPVAFYLAGDQLGERKGLGFNSTVLNKIANLSGGKINPSLEDLKTDVRTKSKKISLDTLLFAIALLLAMLSIWHREL